MRYYFLAFLVVGLFSSFAATETSAQVSVINRYISKQASEAEADEYKEARKIIYADVNHDGKKDAVVQYTLEGFGGGNSWGQMLAVFIKKGSSYQFLTEEVIGGKLATQSTELKSVTNNRITVITKACSEPPQGICENPRKGKSIFIVKNGKLKEL